MHQTTLERIEQELKKIKRQLQCDCANNPCNLKKYVALLTQSGSDAPVAIVLENSLDIEVTYQYINPGEYLALIDKPIFDSPNEYTTIFGSHDTVDIKTIPVFFNALSITSAKDSIFTDDLIGAFALNSIPCVLEIRKYN